MAQETSAAFRIGSVMERSFAIFRRNFIAFSLIALVLIGPYILLKVLIATGDIGIDMRLTNFVILLLYLMLSSLATAAIVYGTFQDMRGQRAGIGDCLSLGLRLVFPVLGVAILASLAIGVGIIFLLVPGFFIMTMLWVALPAAVVERLRVTEAMNRSAALTKGNRWPVFGIIAILTLINIILSLFVSVPLLMTKEPTISAFIWNAGLTGLVDVPLTAFSSVVATVTYHDLRSAKEGIGIAEIARVFD